MVYLIWASAKTQPWNDPEQYKKANKSIENGIEEKTEDMEETEKENKI
jgi:hypothetical protein